MDFSKMVMNGDIAGLEQNFNQLNCIPIDNLADGWNVEPGDIGFFSVSQQISGTDTGELLPPDWSE